MIFLEYPVFQTLNEAKLFSQQHSRFENKQLLSSYFSKEFFFTKNQIWAAPSLYYLQYMLNALYDLDEAYSKYNALSSLEKHGLAHLIISLSAPYVESEPEIILALPKSPPIKYIIYISTREYRNNKQRYRKVRKFIPLTCKTIPQKLPVNLSHAELKQKLKDWFDCNNDIRLYADNYFSFDSDNINYFGNYIHQNVKEKMGHKEDWAQIKILRNRLAHPHEGVSETDLKSACDILCSRTFIEDLEALVFLLSPLSPIDSQLFCKAGYHNNKNTVAKLGYGIIRT